MGIEVKQLTINSTLQREDDKTEKSTDEEQKAEAKEKKESSGGGNDSCLDPDALKADILAECKRMIRKAAEELRSR